MSSNFHPDNGNPNPPTRDNMKNTLRYRNARNLLYANGLNKLANGMSLNSEILEDYIGLNPCSAIDDGFARGLEQAAGKPLGWLDTQPTVFSLTV